MITKPLLILAFNRPAHVKTLIDSLRPHMPQKILVSVDGPRKGNKTDPENISRVLEEIKKIDWTHDIELRIREENLGLRLAVADAVTWVIDKYGEVIVVEDDIEVGPEFLDFMNQMLDEFRNNVTIGHISGYNVVPAEKLENKDSKIRLSMIPESYAWATWSRAWAKYDPLMSWAEIQTYRSLSKLLGAVSQGIVWKINFRDAQKGNLNTWAYRWVASLWNNKMLCVSPNRNLIKYLGQTDGTHTRLKAKKIELPISSILGLSDDSSYLDLDADAYIQRNYFRATPLGVLRRSAESILLTFLKWLNNFH